MSLKCKKGCLDLGYFIETDPHFEPSSKVKRYCECEKRNFCEPTEGVSLWVCPDCGFSFDSIHTCDDERGGYECPLCELAALKSKTAEPSVDPNQLTMAIDNDVMTLPAYCVGD